MNINAQISDVTGNFSMIPRTGATTTNLMVIVLHAIHIVPTTQTVRHLNVIPHIAAGGDQELVTILVMPQ